MRSIEGVLDEARALEAAGDRVGAENRWREAAALERTSTILVGLGRSVALAGRLDEAVSILREALELEPDCADAHVQLGFTLHSAGALEEARVHLERGTKNDEWGPALTVLGRIYRSLQRHSDARRVLQRATIVDPDNPEAWYHLGLTHQREHDDTVAAVLFRKAIEIDPTEAAAHRELGRSLWAMGDLAGAEESIRYALQLDEADAWAHDYLGHLLLLKQDISGAEQQFRRAVALAPNVVVFFCNLGDALGKQGRFAEAESAYTRALALDVSNYLANLRMGQVLIERGQPSRAKGYLERAVQSKPDERRAHSALQRVNTMLGGTPEGDP